jgi:hypothetical protein
MTSWKPIGQSGYEVSEDGEVRRGGRLLRQWRNDRGYMLVRLSGPRRVERVHRLVASAFVPNPQNKPFVNHLNCIRDSNHFSNLEWCTQKENLDHASRLGRMQKSYWIGRRSPNASLAWDQVVQIRERYAFGGVSWETLGREFNVSKKTVGNIVSNKTYLLPEPPND